MLRGRTPAVPMTGIWRTIRGYILWSYERGTLQYDVMVTLILLFVFLSPYLDQLQRQTDRTQSASYWGSGNSGCERRIHLPD